MFSGSESPPPPTITVPYQECRGQISLRQLAQDLNASCRSLRRSKNWLVENLHPAFDGYIAENPLTPEQANTIITYRSYTTAGIKGDALLEKMFPDTATPNAKKNALRDLFEQHNISPEKAANLTHSILRIFDL